MATEELKIVVSSDITGLGKLNSEIRKTRDAIVRTTVEFGKESKEVNDLKVRYDQLTKAKDQYNKTTKELGVSTKRTAGQLLEMGENLTVVAAGLGAVGNKIATLGKDMVNSFVKQEIAVSKLRNGLANLGDVQSLDRLVKQANELQKTTIFADEDITNAQAMLTTFKLNGQAVEELTPRILDMAAAFERTGQGEADLQQIAVLLGKATGGDLIMGLQRWGVVIDDNTKKLLLQAKGMERVNLITKVLDENFKGTAETVGNTFGGKLAKLQNQIDDTKESFGEIIATGITPFIEAITDLGTAGTAIIGTLTTLGSTLGTLAPILASLKIAFGLTAGAIGTMAIGLTGVIAEVALAIKNLADGLAIIDKYGFFSKEFWGFRKPFWLGGEIDKSKEKQLPDVTGRVIQQATDKILSGDKNLIYPDWTGVTVGPQPLPKGKGGPKGGRTPKEVRDIFADTIRAIQTGIQLQQLQNGLTTEFLNLKLAELFAVETLADTDEKRVQFLELQKDLLDNINKLERERLANAPINLQAGILSDFLPTRQWGMLQGGTEITTMGGGIFGSGLVQILLPQFEELGTRIGDIFGNVMEMLNIGADSFIGKMLSGFNQILTILQTFLAIQQTIGVAKGIFSTILSLIPGASLAGAVAARASGGPVASGQPYVVGERGAELFMPDRNGYIMNNADFTKLMASQSPVNIYIGSQMDALSFFRSNAPDYERFKNRKRL